MKATWTPVGAMLGGAPAGAWPGGLLDELDDELLDEPPAGLLAGAWLVKLAGMRPPLDDGPLAEFGATLLYTGHLQGAEESQEMQREADADSGSASPA